MAAPTFTTSVSTSTNFGKGHIGTHGNSAELKTLLDNHQTIIDELTSYATSLGTALLETDWLDSCKLAGVGNVNIASAPATFDGVAGVASDRILLLEQTDPKENGIYVFAAAASAMTRATDFDESAEVTSGAQVRVMLGTKHGGKAYYVNAADPIVVGTNNITFALSGYPKNNFAGAAAPVVGDDVADGYDVGSIWYDVTATNRVFICLDNSAGAAVWHDISDITVQAVIPTATSDSAHGFGVGSRVYNTALARWYRCTDNTATAAVWVVDGVIFSAGAPGVGDDDADLILVGQKWVDTSGAPPVEYTCVDNSTGAAVWIESNGVHVAAADPTVAADDAAGFKIGDTWFATTSQRKFYCYDNATGAAIWVGEAGLHVAAAAPTANEDADDGYYAGFLWLDTTGPTFYFCVDATAAAAVWRELNDVHVAAGAPTTGDDTDDGYKVGSEWYSTTYRTLYVCLDASAAAAVWNATAGEGSVDFAANGIFRATYDFATAATHAVGANAFGPELPDNAIVYEAFYEVLTNFASPTGPNNATVGLGVTSDAAQGLVVLVAINGGGSEWLTGGASPIKATLADGATIAQFTTKTTARRTFNLQIGVEDITAGVLVVWGHYAVTG